MTTNTHTKRNKITSSWQFWGALLALSFGGIGFAATSMLLRLPTNPNCSKFYLPFASATNRIYCGQLQAEENTIESLLKAIALVDALPEDHPLRTKINTHLTEWGNQILALGEKELQAGNLDKAINIAKQIPPNITTDEVVDETIEKWRSIWKIGKEIEVKIEEQLVAGEWNQAFLTATDLLNISNDYWKINKYQEIVNTINLAREENKKLDGAYAALRRKKIDDFLKAITIASAIPPSSYSYQQATKIIEDSQSEILDYAQNLINNKRWNPLFELSAKIPDDFEMKSQAKDWGKLASAGKNADDGTIIGLDLAIAEAKNISENSAIYGDATKLIQTWELVKEDLAYLADARILAQPGDISSLTQAIGKARLISSDNPLYREAQREVKTWQRNIERMEDQPYLSRAKELGRGNSIDSWQAAINQASLIRYNRVLYPEAQKLISQWKRNIQKQEDQPLLNQALALANQGNYQGAINAASRIRSGRVLYREGQRKIRTWRREIKAQNDLNKAYQIAQSNKPESLLRAIQMARRVPSYSRVSGESRTAINRWSEQMLAIARSTSNYSLKTSIKQAINIADMIPYGTSAYRSAQDQISSWKNLLKPPLVIPPMNPIEETSFSSD